MKTGYDLGFLVKNDEKKPSSRKEWKIFGRILLFCKEGEQNRVITRNKDMNMEPSIKDKYIILGFIFVAICMISFFITIIIAASFNQDNFVRLIVFVCSNLLGWLLYLSFQTVIFDTYEIYRIKFGKRR